MRGSAHLSKLYSPPRRDFTHNSYDKSNGTVTNSDLLVKNNESGLNPHIHSLGLCYIEY